MMTSAISFRNAFFLIILFSALTNLVVGGLVLTDSPRRRVNRLFAALSVLLSFWGISFICLNLAHEATTALFWTRAYAACLLFVPPLFYHLVLGSIGGTPYKGHGSGVSSFYDRIKQLAYVFSLGWFFLTVSNIFPQKVAHDQIFAFPQIGQQFFVAAFVYLGLTVAGVSILARSAVSAQDPNQKNRLLFMSIVGVSSVVIGGVFSLFMIDVLRTSSNWIIPMGHLAATCCLAAIAYSLTTSQLYQFSEIIRKMTALLVMTLMLLTVFGGTNLVAGKLLVPYIPHSDFFALGMASVIMALLFHPLRFHVQNLVDRVFFAQRYDQMQRLMGLARRVLSSADREELLGVLFASLQNIGFGSVTLMLKDPQKSIFHIRKSVGLSSNADGFFLRADSLLIQYLREEKKELIRDEVTRRILADWERQALTDEMEILEAEICFPLFSTRRRALFGVLVIGNSKLGYSSYLGRNIFWLKSVIDNAGIMLDNFYHYEFANALIPYVGRTWADEMRRNKEGFRERLAGHRTWVSVVMVDIRHFTTMSAHMDPRDVVGLLKEFRSRVAPVVYRYQGSIDKFIGDAVMIVFGLPILPHLPNPDKNAVECAAHIMKEIEALNKKRIESGIGEKVSIGIGVSSGEVIAGNVDSGDRLEYTVIGDAPNMVARLEDKAGDNQILLSPATYRRVKDHVDVQAWPAQRLTGFDEPVVIYELKGLKDNSFKAAETETANPKLAANQ